MTYAMRYIKRSEEDYPFILNRYERMPEGLYVCGDMPDMNSKSAAIVGARACSEYGRAEAKRFAGVLAAAGVQIISGMALGIDSAAHEGALEAGGRTFAVLGSGADVCYPYSKERLYRQIIENGGVLSEFEPGTPAMAYHFPIRNRIISGLSDAVIIIEARKKSGSLITADYALEQNKTIYALPGRVRDSLAEGTNELICQGAVPAISPEQILKDLGIRKESTRTRQKKSAGKEEKKILDSVRSEAKSLEQIHEETGLDLKQLSTMIPGLVIQGLLCETISGRYLLK